MGPTFLSHSPCDRGGVIEANVQVFRESPTSPDHGPGIESRSLRWVV